MTPDWSAQAEPVPYAKLDNPQSLNLYSYVQNNPVSAIDPDGHYLRGNGPEDDGCPAAGCTVTVRAKYVAISLLTVLDPRTAWLLDQNAAAAWWHFRSQPCSPCTGTVLPEGELEEALIEAPGGSAASTDAAIEQATPGQIEQARRVMSTDGPKAVQKAIRTLEKRIAEHEEKIMNATGHISSMEREVRNFQQLLKAYKDVLGGSQ